MLRHVAGSGSSHHFCHTYHSRHFAGGVLDLWPTRLPPLVRGRSHLGVFGRRGAAAGTKSQKSKKKNPLWFCYMCHSTCTIHLWAVSSPCFWTARCYGWCEISKVNKNNPLLHLLHTQFSPLVRGRSHPGIYMYIFVPAGINSQLLYIFICLRLVQILNSSSATAGTNSQLRFVF